METNGDNFAVTIPFLANMAYHFVTLTPQQIQAEYNWQCFVFLLAIFVSVTNQVSEFAVQKDKCYFQLVSHHYY